MTRGLLAVSVLLAFERYFARLAAERQRVDPPDRALQPIRVVTRLGPTLAERLGSDR